MTSPSKKAAIAAWDKYQDSMTQSGGIDDDLREIIERWRAESKTANFDLYAPHGPSCGARSLGADGRFGPCTCGLV